MKKVIICTLLVIVSFFYSCTQKSNEIDTSKKVIIIGAGTAGLTAANYLKTKGVESVVVLEAQDKVGGRLKTDRSLGVAFDEGASWIHGPIGNPITPIAELAGAKTFFADDYNTMIYDKDGTVYTDQTINNTEKALRKMLFNLDGSTNKSFADAVYDRYPEYKNSRLWKFVLSAYLEFDIGGDIHNISSTYFYNDEAFDGEDLIITNGYDRVANYLAKDIDVRLLNKVKEINYTANTVVVTTDQNKYEADYVLITVPLGVLKRNIIKFSPSLPKKTQQAINKLQMGTVNKFLLTWDKPFWDNNLQYIGYTPEEKGKFNYFLNVGKFSDKSALMTFSFGEYSKLTEKMPDSLITKEIMGHLKAIYGKDIPNPTKMKRTKWNTNQYTYGSYSFATNGSTAEAFDVFEEEIANKLFFAGEHTIADYRGTVHGAYLSGIREAKKIIDLIKTK